MSLRWSALVVLAALSCWSCGSRPKSGGPPPPLEVSYAVEAKPRSHFEVRVPARGHAQVAAHRTLSSEPHGPAGFYGAPMTQELRAEIERHVEAGRLIDRHDEPDLSEDKTGFLRVARGNRRGELSLSASDASSSELRSILEGLVSRAVDRPVSALRLQAKARFDGPNVKVRTRLVQLGEQPIAVGVTDAHDPLKLRVLLERGGRLVDEQQLGPEDLTRLVAQKQLPRGWHTVAPGSPWKLVPFLIRSPNDREHLFARVEATLRVRTKGRAPIVIELTSPSVSVEYEEEVDQ